VSLYLDSSALLKRYVDEPDSADCERILAADAIWITGRHTWVEVVRNLARLVSGREQARLLRAFRDDWNRINVVELDQTTIDGAAEIAKAYGVRTLDALHLAAAQRVGGTSVPFVTFDVRQAQAARAMGMTVLGK
jgi:uncharacterized protein